MSDARTPWWGRLLGKKADAQKPGSAEGHRELPVRACTVGLCFDYERDLAYDSAACSDAGLEHILGVLQRHGLRGTFNCAAKLCEEAPHQIRQIADAGHELAVYGYAGESWAGLSDEVLKQLVYRCRHAFAKCGLSPIGFRSKSTQCDERLARELMLQRFRYNSQHDHAKHPYILVPDDFAFARIPVCTDDRGFVRSKSNAMTEANALISKHHRYLRKAVARRNFVSIGFHPWILGEEESRMDHWEEWLETAIRGGARIGAMEDALPATYRRLMPTGPDE